MMDSSMELVPPAPQSPPQQLLSPCQSPKPIDGSSEKIALNDGQDKDLELHNDSMPTSDDRDDSISLLYVQGILKKESSVKPSLFAKDSQDIMDDTPMAENNIDGAKNHDKEDSHAMNDNHVVEDGYAMEGGHTTEDEEQKTLEAFEPEANSEEDSLPTVDNIAAQVSDNPQSQKLGESEDDDTDIAEEDEGSEFNEESSTSSSGESDHEAQGRNCDSAKEKKSNKPGKKLASTAQEYVAQQREKEDRKLAQKNKDNEGKPSAAKRSRKRKLTGGNLGPSKTLKTANGTSFYISNGGTSSSNDDELPPPQSIEAKTHADQMAQLMAGIPENCDNRRKSTQKKDLNEAKSVFGFKRVEADNGKWKIKGMQTSIHSYQLTAVAWMVKRELARNKPFGGILADTMGMGKTVMALACIMGNQASSEDIAKFCKTTLVVVPSKEIALQWEAEAQV
jgi:SNF2 family DNA or RNA helicase